MVTKTITYQDPFTDQSITEDHYFHLSKADIIHMEMGQAGGGLKAHIERIVAAENGPEVMRVFREIIKKSYGKRSAEGRFIKTEELANEFLASEAYGELLMELLSDPAEAAAFINGVAPKSAEVAATAKVGEGAPVSAEVAEEALAKPQPDPTGLTDSVTPRVLTRDEMIAMDGDELKAGIADGRYKLS